MGHADIFMNNALNNGLLPVTIPSGILARLNTLVLSNPGTEVRIDLEKQILSVPGSAVSAKFPVNAFRKECLLKGLDNVDYLLSMKDEIMKFEPVWEL